ncbi:MAG: HAD hydrolase family protein [Gemmataceae bacterium]
MDDRARNIDLLVLDVDGVLTDGTITYTADGVEVKSFHVRDGSGLVFWQRLGKDVAIVTGRKSRAVAVRAQELGIARVRQGAGDKLAVFRELLTETGIMPERIAAVGDDLPDLPVLAQCGLAIAVADACPEVRAAAHWVTAAPGGRGAVREVIERILDAQGRWRPLVESLRG